MSKNGEIPDMTGKDGEKYKLTSINKAEYMQKAKRFLMGQNGADIFLQDATAATVAAAQKAKFQATTREQKATAESDLAAAMAMSGPSDDDVTSYIMYSRTTTTTDSQMTSLVKQTRRIKGQQVQDWMLDHMDEEMRRQLDWADNAWSLWKMIGEHGGNEKKNLVDLLRACQDTSLDKHGGNRSKFAAAFLRTEQAVELHKNGHLVEVDTKALAPYMLAKIPAGLYKAQQKNILEGVFKDDWNWSQVVDELTSGAQETGGQQTRATTHVNATTAQDTAGQGPGNQRRPAFCWNFQSGTCTRGTECRFLHELDPNPRVCFNCQQPGHLRRNCPQAANP